APGGRGGRPDRGPPRGGRDQPRRQSGRGDAPARPAPPKGLGGEQVEGRQAVRELLIAGRRRVRDIWLAEGTDESEVLADILELAGELRVTVRSVSRSALEAEARSEAPQGVLAHADTIPEAELDTLAERTGPAGDPPFLLCLDSITDPGNLGALLRTAECAGVTGVIVPRHRAAHVTPTVAKAAAGAVEHLPMALVSGLPAALARLRDRGVWVVGLDADGDTSLFGLNVAAEPVAIVLGAEGTGLSRLTRERCDVVASIPLRGALGSLNVAAAAALACFEVARSRLA
ncbi:MAG TPA: 23S rRNA (guanosine(2251)-2'-O)-methyltransferase RlmB, partial [Acidimicrobiales bacterium]|nr:23S rRNA (guanosine(2251)-2'-O)-methyltransferase RlmB [Acidimicrobiales bacterium]